ncbi:DUF4349 domain-containing protein [Flavobacterium sp. SUN046]|uniref:DUF4349 domain-containing protein n=1 Tax=Flavobacterium sp. SUN046 TaxID=3002440 RepID=UPI002DC01075|nr:DUF4349 domain-containing protein [Flavobacterium sp. SUN046]MEC4048790.1 DUF4349 domain-containing protein [Flavobacterium sp. SUN046]
MNKPIPFATAVLLASFVISCKQSDATSAEPNSVSNATAATTDSVASVSNTTQTPLKEPLRKFVRTADIKCKVKDVYHATEKIEDATKQCGGFVTYTNLQSTVSNEEQTKISPDSSLVSTKYTVENNITLRVPNQKMDTLVKCIAKQVGFLNYRVIKADDVSLQLLSNKLSQDRSKNTEERMAHAIDAKGKKLNQVMDAEASLDSKKEANDEKTIQNLSLQDQVNYSTLKLELYQDTSIKQVLVANEKSINAYRPHIGLQVWDSVKTGWFTLEAIIAFVILLWPFLLLGGLGVWGYRTYIKK